jgi:hypothetical protein
MYKIVTDLTGQIGVDPREVVVWSTDDYATVTAAGYLKNKPPYQLQPTDFVRMVYGSETPTLHGYFKPSISNGIVTLSPVSNPGEVSLIGAATTDRITVFADTTGDIKNSSAKIVGDTLTNLGNMAAGESGTEGILSSFPTTADKGSLHIAATNNNAANVASTIQNGQVAEATTYTLPVAAGGAATLAAAASALVSGNIVLASGTGGLLSNSGYAIKSISGAVALGGSATQSFSEPFCTALSVVIGAWVTSANAVSIQKIVPGVASFDVISSGDAGAGTFNYLVINGVSP